MEHIIYIFIILMLLVKVIKQSIRINGYEDAEDQDSMEYYYKRPHLFYGGDCCRCPECTERFIKELEEDLTKQN